MNFAKWKCALPLIELLLAGCNASSLQSVQACPDIQGSYKFENVADFYIQKQTSGEYLALMMSEQESPEFLPVVVPSKQALKDENYSECTVMIKGLGLLMPSNKNAKYSVSAGTQNYMTEQKIDTPLVILYMAGFQSAVFGVEKISNNLPQTVTTTYANRDKY